MSEVEIVEWLKATYGPGVTFLAIWLSRTLWKLGASFLPKIIELIAEMKSLRISIEKLEKMLPRVDKLEVDMDHSFKRLRVLENENEIHKPNGG